MKNYTHRQPLFRFMVAATVAACGLMASAETIPVNDIKGLHAALDKARGHKGDLLDIVLAEGEYKTDKTLALIDAQNVRISSEKGASIIGQKDVMLIAYCNNIKLVKLTILGSQDVNKPASLGDLVRLDHSTDVHLENCSLSFATTSVELKPAISNAPNTPMKPSKELAQALGAEVLEVITHPDHVLCFRINPTNKLGPEMLGGHVILEKGPELTAEQTKTLIGIMFDQKTFGSFGAHKRSRGSPEYAFKFSKGVTDVEALIDLNMDEVTFSLKGKPITLNSDGGAKALSAFIATLFPKNPPETR